MQGCKSRFVLFLRRFSLGTQTPRVHFSSLKAHALESSLPFKATTMLPTCESRCVSILLVSCSARGYLLSCVCRRSRSVFSSRAETTHRLYARRVSVHDEDPPLLPQARLRQLFNFVCTCRHLPRSSVSLTFPSAVTFYCDSVSAKLMKC